MFCLNSRGCNNAAKYIEEIKSSNFCSYECYLIYKGEMKPRTPIRKTFKDKERQHLHDLYIWAVTGDRPDWVEKNIKRPNPEEWIVTIEKSTYLWDDFERKYTRYMLGYGLVDDFGNLITDENSDYYKAVIERINNVQFKPETIFIQKTQILPKIKKGVKKGSIRGHYKIKEEKQELCTKICLGCGQKFATCIKQQRYHTDACKQDAYRKRKNSMEIERKKVEFMNI
ncbi:MAG: hypothetical protein MUO82_09020 [Candidatus Thermoplasmatota archaeon]|nr:hypothetical protein [Candidatus Thermoplasmatota archaeon]